MHPLYTIALSCLLGSLQFHQLLVINKLYINHINNIVSCPPFHCCY